MQTQTKKLDNINWIHIVNPEIFETRKLLAELSLNEQLANEIVNPSFNARVDTMRNAVYLTLHFPFPGNNEIKTNEIDFLIKTNTIITACYEKITVLENYVSGLQYFHNSHGGNYFVEFVTFLYNKTEDYLDKIGSEVKDLQAKIFILDEREAIENIASLSKKVSEYKNALRTHNEVLKIFETDSNKIFGFEFVDQAVRLRNKYNELMNNLDNQREILNDMKDTINFLLTNKTNQIVKIFTVVSFVMLPLTFISGFFGMNTRFPSDLVNSDFGTIYIMALMLVVSISILLYLHFKKII